MSFRPCVDRILSRSLRPAQLVPGMWVPRHLNAQRVDRIVSAAEQGSQIRSAECEIDGLLGPSDDPEPPAIRRKDPNAARPGAIDPADAVDLEPIGYAGLAAFVHIGEDAAPDHVAGSIETDPMDVLRRAGVR